MPDPLSNLKTETWYKAWVVAAAAALVAAIAARWGQAAGLALGFLLIGLGFWINRPIRSVLTDMPAGILSGPVKRPSFLGHFCITLGIVIVLFVAYRLTGLHLF